MSARAARAARAPSACAAIRSPLPSTPPPSRPTSPPPPTPTPTPPGRARRHCGDHVHKRNHRNAQGRAHHTRQYHGSDERHEAGAVQVRAARHAAHATASAASLRAPSPLRHPPPSPPAGTATPRPPTLHPSAPSRPLTPTHIPRRRSRAPRTASRSRTTSSWRISRLRTSWRWPPSSVRCSSAPRSGARAGVRGEGAREGCELRVAG